MKKKCNKKLYKITLHRIFLILIILLAVVLRFWRIDEIFDFHELVHLPITINIANNFIDYLHIPILQEKIHGPLSYFLIAPSIYFLGSTLIALKLPFAISGVLAVIFLYLFVRDFYNEEIALLSSFILTILPGHVILSTTPLQWIFNPFFVVLTLYLFYKYSKTGKSIYLYLGAAIAGLGIMVRISFLFFLIPFLLLVTIFKGLSFIKKHSKKLMIASIFFILGGCYPLILLNLDGNIRVISYELKNRFPITKGGIDLRDVKDNLKYGFTYIFPKFLREYTYMTGDFIVKNDEIFNFLNIFLFALMGMLTIGLWTAYQFLRSSSSSHNRIFFLNLIQI
jgi:4-amino-4-deoxy-L-arabinose transferase-like glycosyltransferase